MDISYPSRSRSLIIFLSTAKLSRDVLRPFHFQSGESLRPLSTFQLDVLVRTNKLSGIRRQRYATG